MKLFVFFSILFLSHFGCENSKIDLKKSANSINEDSTNKLTLISLFPFGLSYASPIEMKTDWEKWSLNGHVKSIRTKKHYVYLLNGSYRPIDAFRPDGDPNDEDTIYFNELGYITKQIDGISGIKTVYVYNHQNELISKELFERDHSSYTKENYYYLNHYLIRVDYALNYLADRTIFQYDSLGRLYSERSFYQNEYRGLTTYFYDTLSKRRDANYVDEYNVQTKSVTIYDDYGNITEDYLAYPYVWSGHSISVFDSTGILIEVSELDENTELIKSSFTYQYQFDEKNNWIKMTEYQGKIPVNVIERTIEYYK